MTRSHKATQMIHARIDSRLKKSTEQILGRVGLSTSEAIRLFFRQVELHQGLPFLVTIPKPETAAAIEEAIRGSGLKRYESFSDLRRKL